MCIGNGWTDRRGDLTYISNGLPADLRPWSMSARDPVADGGTLHAVNLEEAVRDLPPMPAPELFDRFIRWAR
ncbi:hypothetical protein KRMM14A1004_29600 [Krasilnikovia sp. MM14-A1004]